MATDAEEPPIIEFEGGKPFKIPSFTLPDQITFQLGITNSLISVAKYSLVGQLNNRAVKGSLEVMANGSAVKSIRDLFTGLRRGTKYLELNGPVETAFTIQDGGDGINPVLVATKLPLVLAASLSGFSYDDRYSANIFLQGFGHCLYGDPSRINDKQRTLDIGISDWTQSGDFRGISPNSLVHLPYNSQVFDSIEFQVDNRQPEIVKEEYLARLQNAS